MLVSKLLSLVGKLVSYVYYKRDRLRLSKLEANGLKLGKNVYIMEDVEFDRNYPYLIEIGDNCRISKGVRILAHDATTFRDLGITRITPVKILEGTFIGERAIIMPGVTIGPRALIAAGSVVNRDIGEYSAAAGNPARPYSKYSDLLKRYSDIVKESEVFKKEEIEDGSVTHEDIRRSLEKNPVAFIRGVPRSDPYYKNVEFAEIQQAARKAYANLESLMESSEESPTGE